MRMAAVLRRMQQRLADVNVSILAVHEHNGVIPLAMLAMVMLESKVK